MTPVRLTRRGRAVVITAWVTFSVAAGYAWPFVVVSR